MMPTTHPTDSPVLTGAARPTAQRRRASGRIRRAHRKSRQGCANCKLRSIKASHGTRSPVRLGLTGIHSRWQCDESKPQCRRCIAYGIRCGYEPGVSAMELPFVITFGLENSLPRSLPEAPVSLPLAGAAEGRLYEMRPADRDLLARFQRTAILTSGAENQSVGFQNAILQLTYMVSLLMARHCEKR